MNPNCDGENVCTDMSQFRPLAEEVHQMSESETACQYCGISYLLLSKYERMEKHVKGLETHLMELKDYVKERSEIFKKCELLERAREKDGERLRTVEDERSRHLELLDMQFRENEKLRGEYEEILELARSTQSKRKRDQNEYSNGLELLRQRLGREKILIRKMTVEIHEDLKSKIPKILSSVRESLFTSIQTKINILNESHSKSIKSHEQKYEYELRAKTALIMDNERSAAGYLKKLESSQTETETLRLEQIHLKDTISTLNNSVNTLRTQLSQIGIEHKASITSKTALENEVESLSSKLHITEQTLHRSQKSLDGIQSQFAASQNLLAERGEGLGKAIAQKDLLMHELNLKLEELKGEVVGLKTERNKTIDAHQSRVKQLQDKFLEDIEKAGEFESAKREKECRAEFTEQVKREREDEGGRIRAVYEEKRRDMERQFETLQKEISGLKRELIDQDETSREVVQKMTQLRLNLGRGEDEARESAQEFEKKFNDMEHLSSQNEKDHLRKFSKIETIVKEQEGELAFLKETVKAQCEERMTLVGLVSELKTRLAGSGMHADSKMGSMASLMKDDEEAYDRLKKEKKGKVSARKR